MKFTQYIACAVLGLIPALASANSILGYDIVDTETQKVSSTIKFGLGTWQLNRAQLPKNFNIRVRTTSQVDLVRSQLVNPKSTNLKKRDDGSNYQRDDKKAPFAVGGESGEILNSIAFKDDKYNLNIAAIETFNGTHKTLSSEKISIEFYYKPQADLGPLRVFPGADEFSGHTTKGGRGGVICKVNSLADDGTAGTLRYCVNQVGPRVVVFEVGGTILLKSTLSIVNKFITIAGQTAPSPGITLLGQTLRVQTSEVLVQHLKVRLGDKSGQKDVVEIFYYSDKDKSGVSMCNREAVENVVFDHVSLSWGIDGTFDTQTLGCVGKIKNIALVNSFISEHLENSVHGEGAHSYASLIAYGTHDISMMRNMYAHNKARNPRLDSDVRAQVINNFMYNVGWHGVEVRNASRFYQFPTTANIIGNAQDISLDSTRAPSVMVGIQSRFKHVDHSLYLSDNANVGPLYKITKPNVYPAGEKLLTADDVFSAAPVLSLSGLKIMPSSDVKAFVLKNSGARPADRDFIDARLVSEVEAGRGKIIDRPHQYEYDELLKQADPAKASRKIFKDIQNPWEDDNQNGWSNLEEALYFQAQELSK